MLYPLHKKFKIGLLLALGLLLVWGGAAQALYRTPEELAAYKAQAKPAKKEIIVRLKKGYTLDEIQRDMDVTLRPRAVRKVFQQSHGLDEHINKMKALPKKTNSQEAQADEKKMRILEKRAVKGRREAPSLDNVHTLSFDSTRSVEELAKIYSDRPGVDYAEPRAVAKAAFSPNDTHYALQWAIDKISADEAWDTTTGDAGVIIAIVDSGVDYLHPDLAGVIWRDTDNSPGHDFLNNDNDPMDDFRHGTHCAGIAGAVGNNAVGIAGISWQCKIMPLKFLDNFGEGPTDLGGEAIQWAVDHGADVISNSWNGPTTQTLNLALEYAYAHDVVVVAAAGNDATDDITYPARHPRVISVAATDETDALVSFSSYGNFVDVAAPGFNILSTVPVNGPARVTFGYRSLNGTSQATPHVAGVAALIRGLHPDYTADEIRSIIKTTSDPIVSPDKYVQGRLDALGAIQTLIVPPTASLITRGQIQSSVIRGVAGGENFAGYSLYIGAGNNPSAWTLLTQSNSPVVDDLGTPEVNDGVLYGGFNPGLFPLGAHTLRLILPVGSASLEYRTTVEIVAIQNRAPVIVALADIQINEGQEILFNVTASDADGDAVTLSSGALPSGATFNAQTGVFNWRPNFSQAGAYPLVFTATDTHNAVGSEPLTITVVNRGLIVSGRVLTIRPFRFLPGVRMVLYRSSPRVILFATTNAVGYYEFRNLEPGTYTVRPLPVFGWQFTPILRSVILVATDLTNIHFAANITGGIGLNSPVVPAPDPSPAPSPIPAT